jgi:hypothetical protein
MNTLPTPTPVSVPAAIVFMQGMKRLQRSVINSMMLLTAAFAATQALAANFLPPDYSQISDKAPEIKSEYRFDETLRITAELKAKPVNVVFLGSPLLTEQLKPAVAALGYNVVNEEVKTKIVFRANFFSQGGGSKPVNVALGPVIEDSLKAQQALPERQDTLITKGVGETLFLTGSFNALANAGLLNKGFAVGNIVQTISEAIGIAGAFNKALTGDPRGWCMSRCHEWYKIRQETALFVAVTAEDGNRGRMMRKQAFHEKLVPAQLLEAGLNEAFELLK